MKLTRAEVEKTVRCGDFICVTYRKVNGVARAIRWAEGGKASHVIECLGGFDTVEETIGGGMRTNLYTYLRGNADLIVKRVKPELTDAEAARVKKRWLSLVGGGYGWDSIKRAMVTIPIRRFVQPRLPRVAKVLRGAARVLLPGAMPDCSAAVLFGIRPERPGMLAAYQIPEVTPETLLRDMRTPTVAVWKNAMLVD